MNLDVAQSQLLLANNTGVYLNLDKSNISYYAKFGSFSEFVRVALENIIINWPASLYINPVALDVNGFQIQGYTYENYYYDVITDKATFKINVIIFNYKSKETHSRHQHKELLTMLNQIIYKQSYFLIRWMNLNIIY